MFLVLVIVVVVLTCPGAIGTIRVLRVGCTEKVSVVAFGA